MRSASIIGIILLCIFSSCKLNRAVFKGTYNSRTYIIEKGPGPGYQYIYIYEIKSKGKHIILTHPCTNDMYKAMKSETINNYVYSYIGITDTSSGYVSFDTRVEIADGITPKLIPITIEEKWLFHKAMENIDFDCSDYDLEKIIGFVVRDRRKIP